MRFGIIAIRLHIADFHSQVRQEQKGSLQVCSIHGRIGRDVKHGDEVRF